MTLVGLAACLVLALGGCARLVTAPSAEAEVGASAAYTVTNGNDSGAGSLRDVVAAAPIDGIVTFDPSVTTITLTSGSLVLDKDVTIAGPEDGTVTIRGDGAIARTWTAVDDCGDEASATQTITVLTWQEALAELVADVEAAVLPRGIENSLTRKLVNAIRNLDDGLNDEAREKTVSFVDQVDALSGNRLDPTSAQAWIDLAERILAVV